MSLKPQIESASMFIALYCVTRLKSINYFKGEQSMHKHNFGQAL